MIVIVHAHIELHPVNLAGELAGGSRVITADRCAGLVADVRRLIGGEDHRLRGGDAALANFLAVIVPCVSIISETLPTPKLL